LDDIETKVALGGNVQRQTGRDLPTAFDQKPPFIQTPVKSAVSPQQPAAQAGHRMDIPVMIVGQVDQSFNDLVQAIRVAAQIRVLPGLAPDLCHG
jgi:hypothetical protein